MADSNQTEKLAEEILSDGIRRVDSEVTDVIRALLTENRELKNSNSQLRELCGE